MAPDLSKNVFLVTGAASGMGLATSVFLASCGARLAICDINQPGIDKAAQDIGSQYPGHSIFARAVDVTDRASLKRFFEDTKTHVGSIHGIANFAGTGGHQLGVEPIWQTTEQEFDYILNLNVRGLFNVLGEALEPNFLPELSSIVHITSMFGQRGYENGAVFAASKHAAIGMTKSAALEVGKRGIRVNSVLPYVHPL